MAPELSIIIPIYNVEKYIRQCLDSVVNQTFRDLEIILIDDGSPDSCGAICDEYAARDDRITVIHKMNGGVRAARNDGIDRATGKWLAFIDPDDWCELDYYRNMIERIGDQDMDICCSGGVYREDENDTETLYIFRESLLCDTKSDIELLMAKVLCGKCCRIGDKESPAACWDKLYKAEFIRENGLRFDVNCKAWDDILFNFQAFSKANVIGTCEYIGYHYRKVATSIVNGFNPNKPKISNVFISYVYKYIEENACAPEIKEAMDVRTMVIISNLLEVDYFHPANKSSNREIARQINDMRKQPYYHEAIHHAKNQYLSTNRVVMKYLLQLPIVWPLRLAYRVRKLMG